MKLGHSREIKSNHEDDVILPYIDRCLSMSEISQVPDKALAL